MPVLIEAFGAAQKMQTTIPLVVPAILRRRHPMPIPVPSIDTQIRGIYIR